jgi:hypothetical protein
MKPRILVLTDIGGDPDDEQTLIRLLVYANEFDIEGIIPEMWEGHRGRHGVLTPGSQLELVHEIIRRYGQVRDNLALHADGYPGEADLHDVVKRGKVGVSTSLDRDTVADVSHLVGEGLDTEGSEWIIRLVDSPDPRTLDVNVWGGTADLAQALWKVRATRPLDQVAAFVSRIRVHAIGDQDDTGPWIRKWFPSLFYILDHARDGNKMHSCYRGMFLGGDESLTSSAWVDSHVRRDHGPLGEFYPPEAWTGPNPHGALKEGDTPSWFYFMRNGLNLPGEPSAGGWGGRFAPNGTYWQDTQDTVNGETSGRATVWRWRPRFQNGFQARMDWCVQPANRANHPPVAIANGETGRAPVRISALPGERVALTATDSHDLDGGVLAYRWWVYREAGTYEHSVRIGRAASSEVDLLVPLDAAGTTIHVILEVTDSGVPPLTGYRRVIVHVGRPDRSSPEGAI